MMCALILAAALLLDACIGDPVYAWHPVRLMGRIITQIEMVLQWLGLKGMTGGLVLLLATIASIVGLYGICRWFLATIHPWSAIGFDIYVAFSCIAFRSMFDHLQPIIRALEAEKLIDAQTAVQKIVGRDATRLDLDGVARGAVESVAEGFVDGMFAPLCWFTVGAIGAIAIDYEACVWAVVSILVYRHINTLDSMVGYRNDRYLYFGRPSARLDDLVNFIPARLSLLFLTVAGAIERLDFINGLTVAWRDRLKHASPNAAHTESFVAGALKIRLGGPTVYTYGTVKKPWLGDDTAEVTCRQIRQSWRLIHKAGWLSGGCSLILIGIILGIIKFELI